MTGRDRFRDQLDPLWRSRRRARIMRQAQRAGAVLVNRYVRPGAAFEANHASVTLRDFSERGSPAWARDGMSTQEFAEQYMGRWEPQPRVLGVDMGHSDGGSSVAVVHLGRGVYADACICSSCAHARLMVERTTRRLTREISAPLVVPALLDFAALVCWRKCEICGEVIAPGHGCPCLAAW